MTSQSTAKIAARIQPVGGPRARGRDLVALTKPGIVIGNVLMTAAGLALAPAAPMAVVIAALMGTALLIGACGALNMVFESDIDARMNRTRNRPVADGRISSAAAATFGVALFLLGALTLAEFTNLLTATLGILACIIYVGIYTPLKQRSFAAVPVGAVAGALPPVIGWFAAGGAPSVAALMLFSAIFVWQIPHFMAIGLRRWKDYRDAGFRIGANPERLQSSVAWIRLTTVLLQLVTLGAVVTAGGVGFAILGFGAALVMLLASFRPAPDPVVWARRVFLASLFYLPAFALGAFLPF